MERTFAHDHVLDRTPVLTARFNKYGQLIEIETSDGHRATDPIQTFETTPLAGIDLKKVETFNVLVWKDVDSDEEHYCVHWRCRLYCAFHRKDKHPHK
jgi:hypothetical protein